MEKIKFMLNIQFFADGGDGGDGGAACPYSHIAMFRKDNGNGTGVFFGQNQGGKQVASQINIPYAGIIGVLRPKCYVKKCNFKSSGAVKALYNGIRVRTAPSTSKGDTGLTYDANMVLYYNDIVLADGWYWAKYLRSNGGQAIVRYVVKMERQVIGNRYKPNDLVRIIKAIDVEGKKFKPMYSHYKVVFIDDDIVHIGIGSIVKHKLLKENIELYK